MKFRFDQFLGPTFKDLVIKIVDLNSCPELVGSLGVNSAFMETCDTNIILLDRINEQERVMEYMLRL